MVVRPVHFEELTLEEGDLARGVGRVLIDDNRVLLSLLDIPMHRPYPPADDVPTLVELNVLDQDRPRWLRWAQSAALTTITGRWNGSSFETVTSVSEAVDETNPTTTQPTQGAAPAVRQPRPGITETLGELFDTGVLASFWVNGDDAWAAATDCVRVAERLVPFYGSQLRVVQSRWTVDEIAHAATQLRMIPSTLRVASGESHSDEHQLELTAKVKLVTPGVAELLSTTAPGLVRVEALIAPCKAPDLQ